MEYPKNTKAAFAKTKKEIVGKMHFDRFSKETKKIVDLDWSEDSDKGLRVFAILEGDEVVDLHELNLK